MAVRPLLRVQDIELGGGSYRLWTDAKICSISVSPLSYLETNEKCTINYEHAHVCHEHTGGRGEGGGGGSLDLPPGICFN